jgi:hypothetical protein
MLVRISVCDILHGRVVLQWIEGVKNQPGAEWHVVVKLTLSGSYAPVIQPIDDDKKRTSQDQKGQCRC